MGAVYFAAMPIEESFLLLLALAGLWFWLDTLKAREAGVLAAREACAAEGWQFLDESVAGRGVRLARDDEGRLRLRRIYAFEYSESGFERSRGSITLLGQSVEWLSIRHASRPTEREISDRSQAFPAATPNPTPQPTARIIQLRPTVAAPAPAGEKNKETHVPQDLHD
ncbi:DUF3301 domain-containing protein [Dechloromonas sp. ZY10]|uniref:DUF3301 domain-containing protein n=1 Tax=Dechloromonas aquae TaxID=2664436 RepID=UPI0035299241